MSLPEAGRKPRVCRRCQRRAADLVRSHWGHSWPGCSCGLQLCSHLATDPDTFGDAAVLRIIKTSVGDLQPFDRCLYWWNFSGETRFADRLRMAQASHIGSNNVPTGDGWIDSLNIAERFIQQLLRRPGELRMGHRHIIRNEDDVF